MARPSTVVETWKPRLEAWLSDRETAYRSQRGQNRVPTLPVTNDGMINVVEVARAIGCPRTYLYNYEPLSTLLDLFAEGQGLQPTGARTQGHGDQAVQQRMATVARGAKVDAQAAIEAKATLQGALKQIAELQKEKERLRLENLSLREQLDLMRKGIHVRVR